MSSYNNLHMSLDSGSILPSSQPGIHAENITSTVSEDIPEFLREHVAAEWARMCEEDEYLKTCHWSSAPSQGVQDNHMSFPTLNQFTAPVAGLPQLPPMDPIQHHPAQPSSVLQASLEGPAWSQPGYNGGSYANGPDFTQNHSRTVVDLELWAAGDPRAYDPKPPFPQEQNAHAMTNYNAFLPAVSDSDATMSDHSSFEPSSSASDGTVGAKTPKRKTRHAAKSEDGNPSSSLAQSPRKRRCLDDEEDEIREGKFGFYRLADADAVVMAALVHDPKPVDISRRRTHDADGNLLRTRTFGAMELDDSYPKRSVKITNELPAGMTCVRACGWTDQPCGLFVEMNKTRVAHHLLHWHGVKSTDIAPCKFEDCSRPEAMLNLGRHIEGVHYTTSYECPYCNKRWSRTDSLDRHKEKCGPLLESKARAQKGRRNFSLQDPKKLVYGYIVPARNAT